MICTLEANRFLCRFSKLTDEAGRVNTNNLSSQQAAAVLNALKQRRSVRSYQPNSVPRELLERVLEAAVWAPSAHNRQPWRFAVVRTPAVREALARAMGERLRRDLIADGVPAEAVENDVQRSYTRLLAAPVIMVVCMTLVDMDQYPDSRRCDAERTMAIQSVAMAGQNLLLAAHAVGLGACWTCAPLFCPDIVRNVLDLPADWQPQGIITLGYPAAQRSQERRPLEKSVVWR